MNNKKNKKHFLIFYSYNALVKIAPRDWARINRNLFPKFGFTKLDNDHPTTNQIENYLENNYGFKKTEDDKVVIYYNFTKYIKFL